MKLCSVFSFIACFCWVSVADLCLWNPATDAVLPTAPVHSTHHTHQHHQHHHHQHQQLSSHQIAVEASSDVATRPLSASAAGCPASRTVDRDIVISSSAVDDGPSLRRSRSAETAGRVEADVQADVASPRVQSASHVVVDVEAGGADTGGAPDAVRRRRRKKGRKKKSSLTGSEKHHHHHHHQQHHQQQQQQQQQQDFSSQELWLRRSHRLPVAAACTVIYRLILFWFCAPCLLVTADRVLLSFNVAHFIFWRSRKFLLTIICI